MLINLNAQTQLEELAATEGVAQWLEDVLEGKWMETLDYANVEDSSLDWRMQNAFRTCFGLELLTDDDLGSVASHERMHDSATDPDETLRMRSPEPEPESHEEPLVGYEPPDPALGLADVHSHSEVRGPEPLPSLTLTPEVVEALLMKLGPGRYEDEVLGKLHGHLAAIQMQRGWGPFVEPPRGPQMEDPTTGLDPKLFRAFAVIGPDGIIMEVRAIDNGAYWQCHWRLPDGSWHESTVDDEWPPGVLAEYTARIG